MKHLEKHTEEKFVAWCQANKWECLKLRIDGQNGFPDRTVITPWGVFFVEFKRTANDALRPRQQFWQNCLEELRQYCIVHHDLDEIIALATKHVYSIGGELCQD